ncbi:phage/plasmid primase, P4 family [Alkalihalobacillus sp. LMS6]|uniref:phage/plasmid primase, P4 family n=1 Tax=Alkalihalobacillus sp. LMS6 TaxID=2924034 RepID=UPI0020D1002D|nr:phage/plasmid primase, P4 family [Alkalihalobacillus sp. LMS6]UTR05419.1 phage/plasmid primase, P4 family [Alkalihalobacillus sp. LMS6]
MQYQFNNIPQELRDFPQWIVWRKETRKGKTTKVPYKADGRHAKANDKQDWTSFDDAVKAYETGNFDGIGFMFSKDDPFVGVDLDHCIEEGAYTDIARDIVDQLDSYTEFSPSGDGLHIILKGKLPLRGPATGKKNVELGIEIYRHGRYFTFTGNIVQSKPVNERTESLKVMFKKYLEPKEIEKPSSPPPQQRRNISDLSERDLWEKMFNSKRGQEIKSLFDGSLINNDHSSSDLALCNYLAFWTDRDPNKMDSMFRDSGLMRDKWDRQANSDGTTYGQLTISNAASQCPSTISDFTPPKPYEVFFPQKEDQQFKKRKPFFKLTELGNAERIVYEHGKDIKYCPEREWLIWDNKRWVEDSKKHIETITAKTLRTIYKDADESSSEDVAKKLNEWAQKCERRSVRINSILDARPMVSVTNDELDKHPFLFNVRNGVIDLKTGKLINHDRDYLFTKIADIDYDKDAKCPNWNKFLESIFQDDQGNVDHELIRFMQKAIGYTLTGDISEQQMFFLFGTGRNGKSTFINTIQRILGAYGKQTNSDTFIRKKNDSGINNDIARLDKARFVSAVESEEGQQLSESLVKQITGGERMMARFMRQEFFEFTPEFKVFFTTNHPPVIRGADEGIWRRICQIPFKVTIPKDKIDRRLPQKLEAEMPGILAWAVEGCLLWQREGLEQPQSIKKATQEYREDMDILGPFIAEKCVVDPSAKVEAKEMYADYKEYCIGNGEFELKNRAFYRMLESRGFKKARGTDNKNFFYGIGLARQNPELRRSKSNLKVIKGNDTQETLRL